MSLSTSEIVEMGVCFGILMIYYLIYLFLSFKRPHLTALGGNIVEQQRFVANFLPGPCSNSILGVQTLRNQLIASTFFASSALFVSFFSLSEVGYVSGDDDNDTEDGFISIDSLTFHEVKVLILGLDFFVAFCCFILCTRWAGQMSIIIAACSSPGQEGGPVGPSSSVTRIFNLKEERKSHLLVLHRGRKMMFGMTIFYSIGMRAFFLAFPIGLWIAGTPGLWIGTAILIIFHMFTDYDWNLKQDVSGESGDFEYDR